MTIEQICKICQKIEDLDEEQQKIGLALSKWYMPETEEIINELIEDVKNKYYEECSIENIEELSKKLGVHMAMHNYEYAPLGFAKLSVDYGTKCFLIPYLRYSYLGEVYATQDGWELIKPGLYVTAKEEKHEKILEWWKQL